MATQAWIALTRPGSPPWARGPVPGSWLLLGLVLAGLFTMHGLGTHGTHGSDPVAGGAVSAAAPAAPSHDDHAMSTGHDTVALGAGEAALGALVADGDGGHPTGLLLGLCLAVLAGAVGLLLSRVARRGLLLPRRPVSSPDLRTPRGRDPDPPDLARLSVRRC